MSRNEDSPLRKELEFLYRVATTVHSLDLEEVLKEIVHVAEEATHGDSVLLYILEPNKDRLVLRASKNPHARLLRKVALNVGEGITGWVASQGRSVAIARDAASDPRFKLFQTLPEDQYEAFLSVPIVGRQGVVGVINVQHREVHNHTRTEINLLTAVGKLVGGAVENAQLLQETLLLKDALELRKLVERAKGILMKRRGISEAEAYKMLQKASMDKRKSLKEVSEAVFLIDEMSIE